MKKIDSSLGIGIFDSGMGGISVLSEMLKIMPNERFHYFGDSHNAPYGIKKVEDVEQLSLKACQFLVQKGVKAIVVACNTATCVSIKLLREKFDIPIIGMEPAIKPAISLANNKKIVVMATPITLKEKKFSDLLESLAMKNIIKMPAPELVSLVERGEMSTEKTREVIKKLFAGIDFKEVGVIVLGCTHFIFLKNIIREIIGPEIFLVDGNQGTARYLKDILESRGLINNRLTLTREVSFYNSQEGSEMLKLSESLLNYLQIECREYE